MGMRRHPTHEELEEAIGYSISNMPVLDEQHYYSDLRPVPLDIEARTRYEHTKLKKLTDQLRGQTLTRIQDIGEEAKVCP